MKKYLREYLARQSYITESIPLGKNVYVGPNVHACESGIRIEDNVRIEKDCTIRKNVVLGSNSVVRSGSVVSLSVPANAIVEGNPASIIGFQADEGPSKDDSSVQQAPVFTYDSLQSSVLGPLDLGVGSAFLASLNEFLDERGCLIVGEAPTSIPFEAKRFFFITDVPQLAIRGEHAHRNCEQFLICLRGSCRALVDDGSKRCVVILDRKNLGLYMPPMIWGSQYSYSSDAQLLVLASMQYDVNDYIRSYDEFRDTSRFT